MAQREKLRTIRIPDIIEKVICFSTALRGDERNVSIVPAINHW
jgi:hypothetical protein